jgi:hypothetical protein
LPEVLPLKPIWVGKRERIESVESFITNVFDGPINEAHHLKKNKRDFGAPTTRLTIMLQTIGT